MASQRFGVKIDRIALPDAEALQHVGALAHLDEEHPIGEEARLAVLALPDKREPVVGAPRQVAIEQVDRRVATPPTKYLKCGKRPSCTTSHGRIHSSSRATSAQNSSGCSRDLASSASQASTLPQCVARARSASGRTTGSHR